MLYDLIGKKSVVYNSLYKDFVNKELKKGKNKIYDQVINIRDFYPIETHFENKNEEDIKYFKKLDNMCTI